MSMKENAKLHDGLKTIWIRTIGMEHLTQLWNETKSEKQKLRRKGWPQNYKSTDNLLKSWVGFSRKCGQKT